MRAEQARIETNAAYPFAEETRILSSRESPFWLALRGKKEFPSLPVCHAEVFIDSLSGLFGDLEPHRPAGLLLADRRTLNGVSVWGNVLDFESDDIATTQLAIDGEIEQRQVALAVCHLKLSAIDQTCFGRSGGLAPVNLPLFQGVRLDVAGDGFSLSCIIILLGL